MAPSSKPTVVLVHGAWHCPEQYSFVTDRLSKAGYKVAAPYLPTTAWEEALQTWDPDVDIVRTALATAADADEDIVVLCHSRGGAVAGEATKGFLKKDRQAQGLKGGVISMVYMCAMAPDVRESLGHWSRVPLDVVLLESGKAGINNVEHFFYNDVDAALIAETVPKLKPQSGGGAMTALSFAPWKHVPSIYILCELDAAIGTEAQEQMTDPSRGGRWTVRRLNSGHSPFLNMPDKVVDLVEEAVALGRAEA